MSNNNSQQSPRQQSVSPSDLVAGSENGAAAGDSDHHHHRDGSTTPSQQNQMTGDGSGAVSPDLHRESSPNVDVHDEARLNADSDDGSHGSQDPGKMFIGGLSWQTTAENLRDYFGRFGEVNECMVMRDPATKRARGFGFITFVDPTSVDKVLAHRDHELDGKKIDPKVAFPKRAQAKLVTKTKKVFIGGLSATSTLEDMKQYFETYGKVEDAMLMFDKATQRHRGFGFITFDSDEVADKVCEIHFHEINGKMVECKKAQPKEVMLPVQLNKSRAAAARNLYGMPPEQLLAYASYIPNLRASLGNYLYPNMGNVFSPLPGGYSGLNTSPGTSGRGGGSIGLGGLGGLGGGGQLPPPHQFDTSGIYGGAGAAGGLGGGAGGMSDPQQVPLAYQIQQQAAAAAAAYHHHQAAGGHNKAPY